MPVSHETNSLPRNMLFEQDHIQSAVNTIEHDFEILQHHTQWDLQTVVRVAWAVVLATYRNSSEVCFTTKLAESERNVTGMTEPECNSYHQVVLRIDPDQNESIGKALEEVHVGCSKPLGLSPYDAPERMSAGQFNSMLCFQEGLENAPVGYQIIITCHVRPLGITLRAYFDADAIDHGIMSMMLSQLAWSTQKILGGCVSTRELKGISPEGRRLLHTWNRKVPTAANTCVHDMILSQCLAAPDRSAVCAWDGILTYKELDQLSRRVASHLVARGARREMIIPILLEKSMWMPVAILGVLRAGAAFLLLDPDQPTSRLLSHCCDVGACMAITSPEGAAVASLLVSDLVLLSTTHVQNWGEGVDETVLPACHPHQALYAIFTSGSTGKPKGVIIEHSSFCTSAESFAAIAKIDHSSRVFQFSTCSFDVSISDHLVSLMHGACLCIPSTTQSKNSLAHAITSLGANWADLTPSVSRILSPEDLESIKTLSLGGESMRKSDVEKWAGRLRLVNSYGPAECSVTAASHVLHPSSDPQSIGFGTGGVGWVVCPDNDSQLVPIGAIGELVVEGPIVGRGYLNREGKGGFTDNLPWLQDLRREQTVRAYKTGDLVQQLYNGSLRYIGRKDTQVKLRGQRIELGEVEHNVIEACAGLEHAVAEVVHLSGDDASLGNLVAYIPTLDRSLGETARHDPQAFKILAPCRRFKSEMKLVEASLRKRLPAYMVPATFLQVNFIPLSSSGKIDRRLLKSTTTAYGRDGLQRCMRSEVTPTGKAAESRMEQRLQAVCSHVLNIPLEETSLDESFLSLGGDSITAMVLVARCNGRGIQVTVHDILQMTSLRILALSAVDVQPRQYDITAKVEVLFPLSPIQQLFFDILPDGHNHYNQSFLLRLTRQVAVKKVEAAVVSITERHPMLRARFHRSTCNQWEQKVSPDVKGSYRFENIHLATFSDISRYASECQKSLDIRHGPLFNVSLCDVGHQTQYLFLLAHHLVVDLVSWRIILADMEDYLAGISPSPASSMPFDGWCTLQDKYIRENLPEVELMTTVDESFNLLDYWGLANCSNSHSDTATMAFTVDTTTTTILLGKANSALRTTPVEIIQAALVFSFMQVFSNRPAPLVYCEGHGREPWDSTIDLSRTVGWFTTFWPTATSLHRHPSFIEVVKAVKDARRKMPSKGWSFFSSRAGRFAQELPMEILFNYHGIYQELENGKAVLQHITESDYRPSDVGGDAPRTEIFEVTGVVKQGRLSIDILYNCRVPRGRIEMWSSAFEAALVEASRQLPSTPSQFTLSDFPLLKTGNQELDILISSLDLEDRTVIEDIYLCLGIQKGILLSQAQNPAIYTTTATWEFLSEDPIDLDRFQVAWQEIVKKNSVLRTIFAEDTVGGQWVQVVLRTIPGAVSVLTESTQGTADGVETLRKYREELTPSKPWQFIVLPTGTHSLVCHLAVSHALVDGASMMLLPDQMTKVYTGGLIGSCSDVMQKYITRVNSACTGPVEDFWTGYADSTRPCLFPGRKDVDEPRSQSKLNTINLVIADPSAVQSFCKQYHVTAFNLVQVAWGLVLRTYIGSDDVQFGFLVSSRNELVDGIEDAIGPYINMLLCRMDLAPSKLIRDVVQANKVDFIQALKYQHTSLADIYDALKVERHGLFNTGISFQSHPTDVAQTSGLKWTLIDEEDPTDVSKHRPFLLHSIADHGRSSNLQHDLTIDVVEDGDQLQFKLSYYSSFLSNSQAISLAAAFEKALLTVASSPDLAIKEVEIVTEHDLAQLECWNGVPPCAEECCIDRVVAKYCRDTPLAPAIDAWDGKLSYAELDHYSSRLANVLISYCCIPTVIPIITHKSKWTAVAILAILRAGATFVLLDPSHPLARLQNICHKTGAEVIVSSPTSSAIAVQLCNAVVTVSDADSQAWPSPRFSDSIGPTPTTAAYVVFTSGSMGEPKGVVIEHSALCTSARAQRDTLALDTQSRVLQFSSYAFDVSIADHLTTLMAGGCVCIPSEDELSNFLMPSIERYRVTWMALTPSVATTLDPSHVALRTVKTLVLGGESMSRRDVTAWTGVGQRSLFAAYGPAECSVMTTSRLMENASPDPRNIGTAQAATLWITDPDDYTKLRPIGAVGELLIEGPIVGRGYLDDPLKTSMAFVPIPPWLSRYRSGGSTTAKLYRTGDLVQYQPDSSVRYIGRKDNQVKLRGQRIELGEVEEEAFRAFDDAELVIADIMKLGCDDDGNSSASLVAFIKLQTGISGTPQGDAALGGPTEAFRNAFRTAVTKLRARLPRYMVPAYFFPLQRIPLTRSGKTDRQVLRSCAQALSHEGLAAYLKTGTTGQHHRPTTRREKQLQRLYSLVLEVDLERISLDDDFFHLGGNSIRAMELVARARAEGLCFRVIDIFRKPELGSLAASSAICELSASTADLPLAESAAGPMAAAATADLHLLRSMNINGHEYDVAEVVPATECQSNEATGPMPYFVLELCGPLDAVRLGDACASWMQAHPILRTVFVQWGSQIVQAVLKVPPVTLSELNILPTQEDPVAVAVAWCYQDLSARPPVGTPYLALKLVRGPGTTNALAIRINHSQYDGICFPGLIQTLLDMYQGRSVEKIPEFSAYARYATQQIIYNQNALQFWKQLLAGSTMTPVYRPTETKTLCVEYASATSTTPAMLHSIRTIAIQAAPVGITMATVVKASWASVLWRLHLTEDIVFGQISSGRSTGIPGLDQVIGHCLVEVPVRVHIDPRGRVIDLLQRIQAQQAESMQYETLGLRQIVERCTGWPRNTHFGSQLHHKTGPDRMDYRSGSLACRIVEEGPQVEYRCPFISLDSVEDCEGGLLLDFWARGNIATQSCLDMLNRALGVMIARFLSGPEELIGDLTADLSEGTL